MKHRQIVLMALAAASLGGYAFKSASTDTLPSAATRFGRAVLASDTDTLWSFVPDDERAFYKFDKQKFGQFWKEMIAPKASQFDSFEIGSTGSNGLEVILKSSREELRLSRSSWLISGQLGNYYVPFIVAYSSLNAAGTDPKETRSARYVRFEKYVSWIDENKTRLKELGIGKMRRGPSRQNGQTLDEIRAYFVKGIAKYKTESR